VGSYWRSSSWTEETSGTRIVQDGVGFSSAVYANIAGS
jgi:hypothetical protein